MNLRQRLNESNIGRLFNQSASGQKLEAFADSVASYLSNLFVDKNFQAWKQEILDLMDSIEKRAQTYNARLASEGNVLTSQGIVFSPRLAELYATPAKEPLETRINPVNDFYR